MATGGVADWSLVVDPDRVGAAVLGPTGSLTSRTLVAGVERHGRVAVARRYASGRAASTGSLDAHRDRLVRGVADLLAGAAAGSLPALPGHLRADLSRAEERVPRYLPTNLTASEIAAELFISLNTVKTHMRHIYAKLGGHRRREVVERARMLGLVGPASFARGGGEALL